MIGYKKNFLNFWNISEYDEVESIVSGAEAQDLHHLVFKKAGGSSQNLDEAWNLVPLTRVEHNRAHDDPQFNESLKRMHLLTVCNWIAFRLGLECTITIDYRE